MRERGYWFRKNVGFGWYPATRQGWTALTALLAIEAGGSLAIDALVVAMGEPLRSD